MGKGDQRTKRGKIVRGTNGKSRPKASKKEAGKKDVSKNTKQKS
jgi:ribosomal small subunit protein bTHX